MRKAGRFEIGDIKILKLNNAHFICAVACLLGGLLLILKGGPNALAVGALVVGVMNAGMYYITRDREGF